MLPLHDERRWAIQVPEVDPLSRTCGRAVTGGAPYVTENTRCVLCVVVGGPHASTCEPLRGSGGGARRVWGVAPSESTTSDAVRALRGHTSAERVGVVRALANPSRQVRRLLELARTWPEGVPETKVETRSVKTARQLRPAEVDKLVEAYEAGATTHELGIHFGVWRGTAGRHLKARGIDTRAPNLGQDDLQEAADLYRAGWTLDRLAKRYSIGYNTIRVRLITAGVTMRPKGRKPATC